MYLVACLLFSKNFSCVQDAVEPARQIRSASIEARKLGAQLGINLEVSRELRQQPVLIVPKGAPPKTLLDGLVFALHATLVREGNVTRIVRTKKDQSTLKALDRKLITDAILATEVRWDSELKVVSSFGSPASQVSHLIHADAVAVSQPQSIPGASNVRGTDPALVTPVGRLLRSIVSQIPVESLADIGPSDGRTFSSAPTATEIAIPRTGELLERFATEQDSFCHDPALAVSEDDKKKSHEGFVLPDPNVDLHGLKVLLTAHRDFDRLLTLVAAVYNERGNLVAYAGRFTAPSRDNMISYQRAAIAVSQHKTAVVGLSPEQLTLARALQPPLESVGATDPLWKRLIHPELYDPANYFTLSCLGPWLDANPKPVVAVIPDDLTMAAKYSIQGQSLNTAAFETLLDDSCEKVEEGSISVLRPNDPLCSDLHNCDRTALGTSLRHFISEGQIDLRSWSLLNFEQGWAFSLVPRDYVGLVRRSANIPAFADVNNREDVFQILGAIPEDQWQRLESSGTLEVKADELRPKLWDYVQRYPGDIPQTRTLSALNQIATEFFPDGLPPGARISIRNGMQLALRSPSDAKNLGRGDMAIPLLIGMINSSWRARNDLRRKLDPQYVPESGPGVLDEFFAKGLTIPCTRVSTDVVFDFSRGFTSTVRFLGVSREIGPKRTYSELPDEFKRAMVDEWNRLQSLPAPSPGKS